MSINSTNTDPTLVNQNRPENQTVNPETATDEVAATGVVEDAEVVSETTTVPETTAVESDEVTTLDLEATNELGAETTDDVAATTSILDDDPVEEVATADDAVVNDETDVDLDPTDDVVVGADELAGAAYTAAAGYDADNDGALVFGLTNAIKGGADIQDTFKTELVSMAEEMYGSSEMINEILDDDGNNISVYRGENGEQFRIVEYAHNADYDLNKAALIFDDDSAIELQMLDNGIGGVGIHRISGENEDGSRDYTYVNSQVIQEGNVKTEIDENGNEIFVQNYDQINRADGSMIEDATTTFHANGMISTEYDDDEGVGHLIVGNSNHTASQHYTSEDNYTNPVDTSYAILGEDGFVADWDDGTNVDMSAALYKGFNDELDPFLEELFAELRDPNFIAEGADEEAADEVDTTANGADSLTADLDGDGEITDLEREEAIRLGILPEPEVNTEPTVATEDGAGVDAVTTDFEVAEEATSGTDEIVNRDAVAANE
ncbi:MAG: hypothetical protein HRT47_06440 [Candidatus Caenarcaniphilales bacterium]|nr:hypothetical protein [Candidatus Caenarcaniphilales bacterium]